MIRLSSALRAALATEYGIARMLRLGAIKVFTGPQPVSADREAQGSLLAMITQDGNAFYPGYSGGGLQLKAGPVAGACQNNGSWILKATASGTAGWWRFVWNGADNESDSAYTPRVDGLIGEGLVLPDTTLTAGDEITLDSFFFFLPST